LCAPRESRAPRGPNDWTSLISRSDVSEGTIIRPRRASSALSVALALSACTTYGPGNLAPGQTEADARARLGEPTVRSALANGGSRLDYARGPFGKHTYRVELDAAGKVSSLTQLLDENNFNTLRPGWSKAQVLDRIGPASETRVGWRGVGEVWSYRYESPFCRWFQVWLIEDRVREAAYASDPLCDEKRKLSGE
jgi:hypothetical protein